MERLNEILVELKKIEDDPFNAEKIDKMAKLNKEKNEELEDDEFEDSCDCSHCAHHCGCEDDEFNEEGDRE